MAIIQRWNSLQYLEQGDTRAGGKERDELLFMSQFIVYLGGYGKLDPQTGAWMLQVRRRTKSKESFVPSLHATFLTPIMTLIIRDCVNLINWFQVFFLTGEWVPLVSTKEKGRVIFVPSLVRSSCTSFVQVIDGNDKDYKDVFLSSFTKPYFITFCFSYPVTTWKVATLWFVSGILFTCKYDGISWHTFSHLSLCQHVSFPVTGSGLPLLAHVSEESKTTLVRPSSH